MSQRVASPSARISCRSPRATRGIGCRGARGAWDPGALGASRPSREPRSLARRAALLWERLGREGRRQVHDALRNPRRVGLTFATGLKIILCNDHDVVMIGEIRYRDTANIAVESVLTGHLVLATLHTSNASGGLARLSEMGVEPFPTSSAVDCLVAQRLARRLCVRCSATVAHEPDVDALMRLGATPRARRRSTWGPGYHTPGISRWPWLCVTPDADALREQSSGAGGTLAILHARS